MRQARRLQGDDPTKIVVVREIASSHGFARLLPSPADTAVFKRTNSRTNTGIQTEHYVFRLRVDAGLLRSCLAAARAAAFCRMRFSSCGYSSIADRGVIADRSTGLARREPDLTSIKVLALCSAIALVPLIQLIPLPPWIWTNLPGREGIAKVFDAIRTATAVDAAERFTACDLAQFSVAVAADGDVCRGNSAELSGTTRAEPHHCRAWRCQRLCRADSGRRRSGKPAAVLYRYERHRSGRFFCKSKSLCCASLCGSSVRGSVGH